MSRPVPVEAINVASGNIFACQPAQPRPKLEKVREALVFLSMKYWSGFGTEDTYALAKAALAELNAAEGMNG